jgi:xanthine dehydrogenase accessory factor
MESEKPRTLKFDLNQDPKYDTGLVCGGTLEIFVEPVLPPALLYILGAGHVALNVCRTAAAAGFEVIVTDDRSSYATRERFPAAHEVLALDFEEAMKKLDPNESSYIVIVTRGHRDDMRLLRWAVQTRARYVGMIGSKRKVAITAELIAIRRHASATLPHLSWFKGARETGASDEATATSKALGEDDSAHNCPH